MVNVVLLSYLLGTPEAASLLPGVLGLDVFRSVSSRSGKLTCVAVAIAGVHPLRVCSLMSGVVYALLFAVLDVVSGCVAAILFSMLSIVDVIAALAAVLESVFRVGAARELSKRFPFAALGAAFEREGLYASRFIHAPTL